MKKAMITAVAMLFAGAAFATDLPSKDLPKYFDLEPAKVEPQNTIGLSVGPESAPGSMKKPNLWMYFLSYDRAIGEGFSAGVNLGMTQDTPHGDRRQFVEGKVGYKLAVSNSIDLKFGAGVGERFTEAKNYGFYAFRTGADIKLTDRITWNAVSYQFRNTFDNAYRTDYQNHQVGTGLSYALTDTQSVNASVYRSYNKDRNAHADGILVGYSLKF